MSGAGLAQRIVSGDVPSSLQDRVLMALDMGALIAGAKYRCEFEDRLKVSSRHTHVDRSRTSLGRVSRRENVASHAQ